MFRDLLNIFATGDSGDIKQGSQAIHRDTVDTPHLSYSEIANSKALTVYYIHGTKSTVSTRHKIQHGSRHLMPSIP